MCMEELQGEDIMQVEITTLGAGTYDGEIPMATIDDAVKVLNADKGNFIVFNESRQGSMILNKTNIVSIKRKR